MGDKRIKNTIDIVKRRVIQIKFDILKTIKELMGKGEKGVDKYQDEQQGR